MVAKQLEAFRGVRAQRHSHPSAAKLHSARAQNAPPSNFSQAKPAPDLQLDLFDTRKRMALLEFCRVQLGHPQLHFSLHRAIGLAWGRLQEKGYCRNERPSHSAITRAEGLLGKSGKLPGELPRIFRDLRLLLRLQSAARLFGPSVLLAGDLILLQKAIDSHGKSANSKAKQAQNAQKSMHLAGNCGGALTASGRNSISNQNSLAKRLEADKLYHQRLQAALQSAGSALAEFAGASWGVDRQLVSLLLENGGKKTEIIMHSSEQKHSLATLLTSPATAQEIREGFLSGRIALCLEHEAPFPARPENVIYYSASAKMVANSANEGTLSHDALEKVVVFVPILPEGVPV